MTVRRSFKYRLILKSGQADQLQSVLNRCRELYNAALEERRESYKATGKGVNYYDQQRQLPFIRQERTDIAELYQGTLQDTLRRVDKAFQSFFRRVKKSKAGCGYPRFRGRDRYDSFTYANAGFSLQGKKLKLSKLGTYQVRLHRPILGEMKTCTIKREGDKWYVVISCVLPLPEPLPATGRKIGIDVGLTSFLTTSEGAKIEAPRLLRVSEQRLARAQRLLSRKKRRSRNRQRARAVVAKIHAKVRDQRKDFAHKTALALVRENDLICFEELNIRGMMKNTHLSKSIADAAWGSFLQQVKDKAEWAGRIAVGVNARGTSQNCSGCSATVKKDLSVRVHGCPNCGLTLCRDENAARNILARGIVQAAGLAASASGGSALAGPVKEELCATEIAA